MQNTTKGLSLRYYICNVNSQGYIIALNKKIISNYEISAFYSVLDTMQVKQEYPILSS